MSERSKFSILVNELVRRFEVMCDDLKESEQISIVNHFTKQLRNSGYSQKQASEVILSALKGVMRKKENRSGKEKRYRSGQETLEERITKKLTEATSWFRIREKEENEKTEEVFREENQSYKENFKEETKTWKSWRKNKRKLSKNVKKNLAGKLIKGENETREKIEGVIFIQHTEHSRLAQNIRSRLREIEKVGMLKIKIVERAGEKLVDLLHRSDAWSNRDCNRLDCLPCKSAGEEGLKGACKRRNVIYETYCITCQEELEKIEKEKEEIRRNENVDNCDENCLKRKNENEKITVREKQKTDYRTKYIGETYRSGYERGSEHDDNFKQTRERSHLIKHLITSHPGLKLEELKYGMKIVKNSKLL